ncbi:MAG: hypothetical protein ABIZ70_12270, partial [Gemmatimonadales bacterium]
EASIRSLLPVVSEVVVNIGASEDDTRDRVVAIGDPRIRILDTTWDFSRGPAMLADETHRAMTACRGSWGIYIQADEVLADGSAEALRDVILARDDDASVEGVLVRYRHFYGGFDTVAANRSWYRRETRAVRLGARHQIHSFRDAQGFRVGDDNRRIRSAGSEAIMHHYGWARPAWALAAKRSEDLAIYPWRREQDQARPLLPWFPGIRPFGGSHPAVVQSWISARRSGERLIEPVRWQGHHAAFLLSDLVERSTGWRPFEYRNYVPV